MNKLQVSLAIPTLAMLAACSAPSAVPGTSFSASNNQGFLEVRANAQIRLITVSYCANTLAPVVAEGTRVALNLDERVCAVNVETVAGEYGALEENFVVTPGIKTVDFEFNEAGQVFRMTPGESQLKSSAISQASVVRTYYDPAWAVSFAVSSYNKGYGNPILTASSGLPGSSCGDTNCTQFVSLTLLGGLLKTSNPVVVNNRKSSFTDKQGSYWWYFVDCAKLPSAQSDKSKSPFSYIRANELYRYANAYDNERLSGNLSASGLYFEYVTHDTLRTYLDIDKIRAGDVMFYDDPRAWNRPFDPIYGTMDHAMIVSKVNPGGRYDYNRVQYTQQSDSKTGASLGSVNKPDRLWYVYRPLFWND